ncbi:MarR family winged helix-turn-helix transcriptional regulator [Compostimonas suwonensis]|uniref:DNA-binding MarR family transcriptional regulator n=1 Tax=Compostimonas suwonensis TaxID=1048394 RepID=A0A2M9C4X8_9MICO|nr:MarR family transcriptional regulator [Compostimonas suwonensis]PJJ65549.1 DNA-binding MarR family transcriptional regulator [Compostimonas suwonensis]
MSIAKSGRERPGADAAADPMAQWPTGRLLSTASRLVEHAWGDALDELGLTHAGLIVLHFLEAGPLSQTDLAARARVEDQTMSRTLERLQREGYVTRGQDPLDRRRRIVSITPDGVAVWRQARTLEADVFPEIPNGESFRAVLLSIIQSSSAKRWAP